MDCEHVRGSLDAFVAGELDEREAVCIADHLATCPACALEHEELVDLAADLHRVRDSIRPLQSFGIGEFPAAKARRRLRPAWAAAAAVLLAWTAFATAVVLWPSLAQRVSPLPVGHALSSANRALAESFGRSSESLADVPAAALSSVQTVFSSSTSGPSTQPLAASNLRLILSGHLDLAHAQVRLSALGPVVSATRQRLQIAAAVDVIRGAPATTKVQHVELLVTVLKAPNGTWVATKATLQSQ